MFDTETEQVVGITAGVFDLAHAGHLMCFEYARRHCTKLIVCVQVDPSLYREGKNKPVETVFERWYRLKSCKYVDEIIPYETEEDLENILRSIEYDIRFIGDDHKGKSFTGDSIRPDTFHFNPRDHKFSTTSLRERVRNGRPDSKRPLPISKDIDIHSDNFDFRNKDVRMDEEILTRIRKERKGKK
jgi:glycerol-3-phosphate cytidylyltransferase